MYKTNDMNSLQDGVDQDFTNHLKDKYLVANTITVYKNVYLYKQSKESRHHKAIVKKVNIGCTDQ